MPAISRIAPRIVAALLLVEVAVFGVSTFPGFRSEAGFDPLLDGWLQGAGYVTAAVLAILRPVFVAHRRTLWTWVAIALACRAFAFVIFLSVIREMDPLPYPSLADAGWLAMCAALLIGLVGFVRAKFRFLSTSLLLDGLVGALAIGALALALLDATIEDLTAPGMPSDVLVTNLLYPIADTLLLIVVLGVLVAHSWSPPRAIWALGAGVAGFAIVDSVFLYQSTAGTFRPGSLIAGLSLLATATIAAAPWVGGDEEETDTRQAGDALAGLVVPSLFAAVCVGLLVYASRVDVPFGAVLCAAAGLLVAIARAFQGFTAVRSVAEVQREARTDELTGMANRRAFNERLGRALSKREDDRPLALLIVDLDNFKDINDSFGHHHGDELLTSVGPRLRHALREDDLLARVGGDEFAIVLDGADSAVAERVAGRLHSGFRRPFDIGGQPLPVEASVGVAIFPEHGRGPDELLRHADLAMYDAKGAGVGYKFFSPEHHRTTRERLETVDRLRQAIATDELVLHYQPQVALDTGAVVGLEALVRWQHPTAGLLPPGRFLPVAEGGGLMRALSLCVLEQAVGQLAAWRAEGIDVPVAVNLSVSNLLDAELPQEVAALLERHGVDGASLVVELTEDLFMADPARAGRVIEGLLALGVTIAIDDYGTGYSSLGYLRNLQGIGTLKIDRSFITDLDQDVRAEAIVASTVALARSLGLRLVAEGVENAAVRDRLAELGCEVAQGFFFARPCEASAVPFGVIHA